MYVKEIESLVKATMGSALAQTPPMDERSLGAQRHNNRASTMRVRDRATVKDGLRNLSLILRPAALSSAQIPSGTVISDCPTGRPSSHPGRALD